MNETISINIPYLEIPNRADAPAISQRERILFACNPSTRALMRNCLPNEYPGKWDRMCGKGERLLKLVLRSKKLSLLYRRPETENPADFCLQLAKQPVMAAMIYELTGGSNHENN